MDNDRLIPVNAVPAGVRRRPSKESNVYGRTTTISVQETDGFPTNFTNISTADTAEPCSVFSRLAVPLSLTVVIAFARHWGGIKKTPLAYPPPSYSMEIVGGEEIVYVGRFHNNVQIPNYLYRSGCVTSFY